MLKNSSQKKGFQNENRVVQYLKKRGWFILGQNQKVEGIELDIIAFKNTSYLLVEVKSLYYEEYLENIIKQTQKQRLIKAIRILQGYFKGNWSIYLATVNKKKQIHFFNIES